MKPSIALTIGAIALAASAGMMILLPQQLLLGFGVGTPVEGIVMTRDVGVTLVGVAVTNWLGRNTTGVAMMALLVGNLVPHLLEFPLNIYQMSAGLLPAKAAGGFVIHGVLASVFILGLVGARRNSSANA